MSITLTINGDYPQEIIEAMRGLLSNATGPATQTVVKYGATVDAGNPGTTAKHAEPAAAPESSVSATSPSASSQQEVVSETEKVKPGRKKKAEAPATLEGTAKVVEPTAEGLTIDQAREAMRKATAIEGIDAMSIILEVMATFDNAKKVSEVDPEAAASGAPSAKFAAFIAAVNQKIAEAQS